MPQLEKSMSFYSYSLKKDSAFLLLLWYVATELYLFIYLSFFWGGGRLGHYREYLPRGPLPWSLHAILNSFVEKTESPFSPDLTGDNVLL